jgi:hypothetical protein
MLCCATPVVAFVSETVPRIIKMATALGITALREIKLEHTDSIAVS